MRGRAFKAVPEVAKRDVLAVSLSETPTWGEAADIPRDAASSLTNVAISCDAIGADKKYPRFAKCAGERRGPGNGWSGTAYGSEGLEK